MKLFKKILLVSIAILSASATNLVENKYILSKDYSVTIWGTSNLHNWNETVTEVAGNCNVSWSSDGTFNLDNLYLDMSAYSIKSDMGGIMNNNTYKALKADAHPEIIFMLSAPVKSIKDGATTNCISAQGLLTIAGVTNPVSMQVQVLIPEQGKVSFEGSQVIKMTDYGITPPTALFGTLKTGDKITIKFKVNFTTDIN